MPILTCNAGRRHDASRLRRGCSRNGTHSAHNDRCTRVPMVRTWILSAWTTLSSGSYPTYHLRRVCHIGKLLSATAFLHSCSVRNPFAHLSVVHRCFIIVSFVRVCVCACVCPYFILPMQPIICTSWKDYINTWTRTRSS